MDIERTIEFMVVNQARMDARMETNFARAERRFEAANRRLDRLEHAVTVNDRVVSRLVRYGVSLRSGVRRLDRAIARVAQQQSESAGKLNALIEFMDRLQRGNGHKK